MTRYLRQSDASRPALRNAGFTLIEVLVSLSLTAIAATSIAASLQTAMTVSKLTEVHYAASSLASSRIETLASVDFGNIDTSYNETATAVSWPGLEVDFTRDTTVTVNADESRTIEVVITSLHPNLPTVVRFNTTFALWE